jgi:sialate O-acetylesterase
MRPVILLAISTLFFSIVKANIHLPTFFSDNMVLQQKSNDAIWGTASANTIIKIKVPWTANTFSAMSDAKGKWKIFVPAPSAGGPFTMDISEPGSIVRLKNILIGEVWFCSGQSNMEMPVRGFPGQPVNGSLDALAHAENPQIHVLYTETNLATEPLDDVKGSWTISNAETIAHISAVAWSFGKYLQEVLHVPVGIIHSAWGGTRIECWMSADTLKHFSFVDLSKLNEKNPAITPTILYNAMVAPFMGYGIRGVIWYQGESNRYDPHQYAQLMPALINSWRTQWLEGDFPFYFVQIAPFYYWNETNNASFLREAQLHTLSKTKNTGMVVTLDIGGEQDVHPREKFTIGKRLAYWALVKDYGMTGFSYSGPVYREMKKAGDSIKLYFDYADYGMVSADSLVAGFEIAGTDRLFHPAKAKITGKDEMVVWDERTRDPAAVRYAWRNWFVATLFSTDGLPSSSFRTDDWEK